MTPEQLAQLRQNYEGDVTADVSPSRGKANVKRGSGIASFLKDAFIGGPTSAMLASGADAATLNTAPSMLAGMEASRGMPQFALLNAASQIAGGGESLIDSTKERALFDEATEGHPIANTIGNIGATVAGGVGLKKGIEQGTPLLQKGAEWAGKNLFTRTGSASVMAGAHGAVSSQALGEEPLTGALIGAATTAVFGSALESGMGLGRWALNTRAADRVIQMARKTLQSSMGVKELDADALLARRDYLGERATIADVDPALADFAKKIMYDPRYVDDVAALTREMRGRLTKTIHGKPTLREEFRDNAMARLQRVFEGEETIDFTNPRTQLKIKNDIELEQRDLQPLYDDIFQAYNTVRLKPAPLNKAIDLAIRGGREDGAIPAKGKQTAAWVNKRIAELTKDRGGHMTPEDLQTLKLDINDRIGSLLSGKKKDKLTARRLIAFRDEVENGYLNNLPGYQDLNRMHKNGADYIKAGQLGSKVFQMKPDQLEDMELDLARMGPADRVGFIEGFARSMMDSMDNTAKTGKAIKQVTDSRSFRNALGYILNEEEAAAFIRSAETATQLQNTATNLTGNSRTAERLIEGEAGKLQSKFNLSRMLGTAWRMVTGSKFGSSQAAGEGALATEIRNSGVKKADAQYFANMATAQGPAADQWIKDIVGGKMSEGNLLKQGEIAKLLNDPGGLQSLMSAGAGIAANQGSDRQMNDRAQRHNLMTRQQ